MNYGCGLTEYQKRVLKLAAKGYTDYRIAKMLKVEGPNVRNSRIRATKKIEKSRSDLAWFESLKSLRNGDINRKTQN